MFDKLREKMLLVIVKSFFLIAEDFFLIRSNTVCYQSNVSIPTQTHFPPARDRTETLRMCLNLWCSYYMYVVIAFPDREFALHMFTVIILKAAVYVFFFPFVFITEVHTVSKART